ncbi:MAG: PQQ-binding-like beta-propeller repeat protein [Oligosphaeraceae bacterium]
MTPFRLLLLFLATMTLSARDITGTVWLDADRDGLFSPDDRPLAGILVSDGTRFATTDAQGQYHLSLSPKATTLYVHRTAQYQADAQDFWRKIIPQRSRYDFLLEETPPPPGRELTFFLLGDSETLEMEFVSELKKGISATPSAAMVVMAGDMGNGNEECLWEHRRALTQEHLGIPVAFTCGNHDVDFRGKGDTGEACPYQRVFGPWWYSLEVGEYLLVALPIYSSWGAPLSYDMLDCGDWLKELCRLFPGKKKILLCHDLPDLAGWGMETRTGPVDFDREDFVCALYAHKHMDLVRKYPSGRMAFSVAPPNKGGAGCFAPAFRTVTLRENPRSLESQLWRPTLRNHLHLLPLPDGTLWATITHGGDPVRKATVQAGTEEISLEQVGPMTWKGHLTEGLPAPLTLTASTASGELLSREFPPDANLLSPRWLTQLPGGTAMCTMKMVGGHLIVGVSDDANARQGGLYALDPHTGQIQWQFLTGYGLRNDFATDGTTLYAIDTRANLHAVEAHTGKLLWQNLSDPQIISPAASALLCHNGIVVGGYGRHLRGVSALTGETLWKNTHWKVEERTPAEDKLALADDHSFLVLSRLNGLYRQDLHTGEVLWCFPKLFLNGTPLVAGGQVLVAGANVLYRLDLESGRLLAEHKGIPCQAMTAPMILLPQGLLLLSSHTQGLTAYQSQTMAQLWRFLPGNALLPTGDYVTGHPASLAAPPRPDSQASYVAGNDGALYRVDHATGQGRKLFQGGAPFLNPPLLQDGLLFLADSEGRVIAFSPLP